MMGAKDYIQLARIVRKLRKVADENNNPVWAIKIISTLTAELINFCELDNPRFDRDTFTKATQLTEEEKRLPL